MAAGRRTDLAEETSTSRQTLAGASIGPIVTLSLGAAAIHFAVIPEHFAEWWGFGLFFAAIGWFQALWPIAYIHQPSRRVGLIAIAVNVATVMSWAWSRSLGLPLGPEAGIPEAMGWPDILSGVFEVALIVGLVAAHLPRDEDRHRFRISTDVSRWWTVGFAVIVAMASTVVVTIGM